MTDPASIPDAYMWTGGAGLLGRLMFHAREVQRGRRKPLSTALAFDIPIALAMGWAAYGLCVWFNLAMQPTITAAILGSYLGPYTLDRIFARAAERYFGKASS